MYTDGGQAYSVGREPLTEEEAFVLGLITGSEHIEEHEFHMMVEITQHISRDNTYQFEPKCWEYQIDEKYVTNMGCVPYSERLHMVVDALVKKHYLKRDTENPLIIFEDQQLRFF